MSGNPQSIAAYASVVCLEHVLEGETWQGFNPGSEYFAGGVMTECAQLALKRYLGVIRNSQKITIDDRRLKDDVDLESALWLT
jgi:hypothetical protein